MCEPDFCCVEHPLLLLLWKAFGEACGDCISLPISVVTMVALLASGVFPQPVNLFCTHGPRNGAQQHVGHVFLPRTLASFTPRAASTPLPY